MSWRRPENRGARGTPPSRRPRGSAGRSIRNRAGRGRPSPRRIAARSNHSPHDLTALLVAAGRAADNLRDGDKVDQLQGLDASFLSAETPNAPMHVGSLLTFA